MKNNLSSTARRAWHRILRPRTVLPRDSEAKFAKVFAHSLDMILILDPLRDRILDANPVACRTLGYSKDELVHLPPDKLHPREVARFKIFAAEVLEGGSGWVSEVECMTKFGKPLPTEISASRLDLEDRPCLLLIARDLRERKRVEQQLRFLSRRVVEAQEEERRRVARELHDSVNQLLSSVKFRIDTGSDSSAAATTSARPLAEQARALLDRAIHEIRRISHNLRPSELDDLGLLSALRRLCGEFGARTGVTVDSSLHHVATEIDPDVELTLFRIAQEALTNVEKHAGATRVELRLWVEGDTVVLTITDDGGGILAATRRGLGLMTMQERAAFLGGTVVIGGGISGGTRVTARLPLRAPFADRTTA